MSAKLLAALFITYDGLLDPLGGSQILPYLRSIASHPRSLHVVSFEKREKFAKGAEQLRTQLAAAGIGWTPLSFTSRLGNIGKLWDLARMYFWGAWLTHRNGVSVVHARGHATAQVGMFIKRLLGSRLIFDCRGLWVDERVDKGGWDLRRPIHRLQYRHFKRVERKLFAQADQVVVLTHKVVNEVVRLGATPASKITVIPCCADFNHFQLATALRKTQAKDAIGIPQRARVIGYLGSVGRLYMLDRFFSLFQLAASQQEECRALVITQDIDALREIMTRNVPMELRERVHIIQATRAEVPDVLPAMDVLVSFIEPSYARIAASPTKLAECFAEGIPAICNDGVGDVAAQFQQLSAGIIVDPKSDADLYAVARTLDKIYCMGGQRLRDAARHLLALEVAEERYRWVYSQLK